MTGQLEEEKMQVYVRLGIRLLYKVGLARIPMVCDAHMNIRGPKVEWKATEVGAYSLTYS